MPQVERAKWTLSCLDVCQSFSLNAQSSRAISRCTLGGASTPRSTWSRAVPNACSHFTRAVAAAVEVEAVETEAVEVEAVQAEVAKAEEAEVKAVEAEAVAVVTTNER